MQCPAVVLRIGQFEPVGRQFLCQRQNCRYLVDVLAMKHDVQSERKAELFDRSRGFDLAPVGRCASNLVG